MWHWVELSRLRAASFCIFWCCCFSARHWTRLQCRFTWSIMLPEIATIAEMFEVSYGVIILLIFGRKKMGIRGLDSFVYKCIRCKNLRRVINIGVACKSCLRDAGCAEHGLTLPYARRDFQLRDFRTRGIRTTAWKVLCFPVVPLNLSSSYFNLCHPLQPVSHLKIFIVSLVAVFDVL